MNILSKILLLAASLLCLSSSSSQAGQQIDKQKAKTLQTALTEAGTGKKITEIKVADFTEALQLVNLVADKGAIKEGRFTCGKKVFLFIDEDGEDSRIDYLAEGKEGRKSLTIVKFKAQK